MGWVASVYIMMAGRGDSDEKRTQDLSQVLDIWWAIGDIGRQIRTPTYAALPSFPSRAFRAKAAGERYPSEP